jgi:Transposase DDE domain
LRAMTEALAQRVAALPVPLILPDRQRDRLTAALALAQKLLGDHDDPKAGDRLVNAVDPDARMGKHGQFYVGYMMDVAMDADSEIITAINVLPANGAEAADAITLIQQEEAAQHNDVAALSMDGAGYNGPMLKELTDPAGLNVDVTVPVPPKEKRATFGPERFSLTVISDEEGEVTCPHGEKTRRRQRNRHDTGYKYIFSDTQCRQCPLRRECLENPDSGSGRHVVKNEYEAEYQKVRAKVGSAAYQETRSTHAKVERKLGEMANAHGGRQANFRGQRKVLGQMLLTAMAVNIKRMVKLCRQKVPIAARTLPVRAEANAG